MTFANETDLGPLTWVKNEIDLALARADESLGQAADASDAPARVQFAQTHLHQARGALSIVGLDGLTQFAAALDQLLGALARNERPIDAGTLALARRALASIGNYLEELVHGTPDQPLRLLPLYEEIARARGTGAANPADLFYPDLSLRPKRAGAAPRLDNEERDAQLRAHRATFQRGLLQLLRKPDDSDGPATMLEAVSAVDTLFAGTPAGTLWYSAKAFLQALAGGDLPAQPELKRLCSQLDAQLKRLADAPSAPPDRLIRELLYWLSQIPAPRTDEQRAVHALWRLDALLPEAGATVSAEPLAPLLKSLHTTMGAAKHAWDEFCGGKAAALPSFETHLAELTDAAPQLGRPNFEKLVRGIANFGQWLRKDPLKSDATIAIEVATALLLGEGALGRGAPEAGFATQVVDTLDRLDALMRGEAVRPAETSATVETARRAQERDAIAQLCREIQTSLATVEQTLDDYFRNQQKRAPLANLAKPLKQVEGALTLVGDAEAIALVHEAAETIARFAEATETPERSEFEALAHRLSALGFYVEALQHGPAELQRFLALEKPAEVAAEAPIAAPEPTPAPVEAEEEELPEEHASLDLEEAELEAEKAAELTSAPPKVPAAPPAPAASPEPAAPATAPPAAAEAEIDTELLDIFIEEAHDVLETIGEHNALSRTSPDSSEHLTPIRRSFHTLKGSGRMVGLRDLGEAAWGLEQTLNRWLQLEWPITPALQHLVEEAHSAFAAWVAQLEAGGPLARDVSSLLAEAERLRTGDEIISAPGQIAPSQEQAPTEFQVEKLPSGEAEPAATTSIAPDIAPEVEVADETGEETALREAEAASAPDIEPVPGEEPPEPATEPEGEPVERDEAPAIAGVPEDVAEAGRPGFGIEEEAAATPTGEGAAPEFVETALEFADFDLERGADTPEEITLADEDDFLPEETSLDAMAAFEANEAPAEADEAIEAPEPDRRGVEVEMPTDAAAAGADLDLDEFALDEAAEATISDVEPPLALDTHAESIELPEIGGPLQAASDASEQDAKSIAAPPIEAETEFEDAAPTSPTAPPASDEVLSPEAADIEPTRAPDTDTAEATAPSVHDDTPTDADTFAEAELPEDALLLDESFSLDLESEGDVSPHAEAQPPETETAADDALFEFSDEAGDEPVFDFGDLPLVADETAAEAAAPEAPDEAPSALDEATAKALSDEPLPADAGAAAAAGAEPEDIAETEAAPTDETPERDLVRLGDVEISRPLYDLYLNESAHHLSVLRDHLARLQANPTLVPEERAMRAAHTLAGISGTTRIMSVHSLARALEYAIERLREEDEAPTREQADLLKTCNDTLEAMLGEVTRLQVPLEVPELVALLEHVGREPAAEAPAAAEPAEAAPVAAPPPPAPAAPVVQDELDAQLLPIFIEEGTELVSELHAALRSWSAEGSAAQAKPVARLLHTLKGSARMAGAMTLGEHVHQLESRLEAATEAGDEPETIIDELVGGLDVVDQMMAALTQPPEAPAAEAAEEAAEGAAAPPEGTTVTAGPAPEGEAAAGSATLRVRADTIDRFVNEAGEIGISRTRVAGELRTLRRSLLDLTENVIRLRNQLREVEIQADMQMQSRIAQAGSSDADFDPLEMDRYTRLQELTRMMAESVGDVTTIQQSLLRNLDGADLALNSQGRLTRDLQQALMEVRMVPFENLADRLYRVVRQSAKELGKRATLDLRGGRIEVDRSVLEHMTAPLEHLLRNAVAHGIESPEKRRADGKSEIGCITLTVSQEGNEIAIVLTDDGSGLDYERIAARARANGLLGADEAADERRLTNLIFIPGFTTAGDVSLVSGRGVGMDVVKAETAAVGGRIDIHSKKGQGTEFRIFLPLTLAVTQALLVTAGGRTFAIPSSMIAQVLELKAEPLDELVRNGGAEWQDEHFAYRYLPHLLGDHAARPEVQRFNWVLLLRAGAQTLALHVDSLRGNQEIVVKAAGPQLARVVGVSGATVLGDGEIVLILNPVALASRSLSTPEAPSAEAAPAEAAPAAAAAPAQPTIMVVDDSLTVRKITGRLLEREGYRVVTAKDGVDALEHLIESVPDVILSDIEMPRMDGFDLLRNIRADERTRHVPVVMITSRLGDKHRLRAEEIGASHYLGKPYEESELLELLRRYTADARAEA